MCATMNKSNLLWCAGAFLLAACDGPHEEAGEKADVRSGAVDSESSLVAGPAEKAGERLDEAERKAPGAK